MKRSFQYLTLELFVLHQNFWQLSAPEMMFDIRHEELLFLKCLASNNSPSIRLKDPVNDFQNYFETIQMCKFSFLRIAAMSRYEVFCLLAWPMVTKSCQTKFG